ncbi:hypothetical protein WH47_11262 [Habropoda laboriosa]|uniref:Uncharacterized protein n=1 Tax=Habropoda laboriosa TaxID=597456 RepID=A0A0L7QKY4_9HYME|nr:hypothetical protein WH47_11262 [Habropoda laboriosa]
MYITTNKYFVPKHFVVRTFYGKKTCFCWNEDKLSIFAYSRSNDSVPVKVLTAPAPIKTIQSFNDRIFLICTPQGVYKLSRNLEFAVLSKHAIGMGTVFYEVLTPRKKHVYLDNKQKMTNKMLFEISSKEEDENKLCIYPLNVENVEECFRKALVNNDSTIENLCIIGDGQKLLTLINETVQIIYNSIYSIKDIIPVGKDSKIAGLLLLTNIDVIIVMHARDNMVVFEKTCLVTQLQAVCAGFSQLSEHSLWMVYSDKSKLYYAKIHLSTNKVERIEVEDKSFVCLQYYDSKIILGLTEKKQLVEFSTDTVERTLSVKNDTFTNLHFNMLKCATFIMDKIYKGSEELHFFNETLITEENKLKRINLYAHKHKVRLCPKIVINRIANRLFLSASFHDVLPKNCWVVLNVKSEHRSMFCTKEIVDQETIVDIYIPENLTANFSEIAIDLIVVKDEGQPWCLIRNYVINPLFEKGKKTRKRSEKFNFINSKIAMLESLIEKGNVDMKKLSEIKKNVRKEVSVDV